MKKTPLILALLAALVSGCARDPTAEESDAADLRPPIPPPGGTEPGTGTRPPPSCPAICGARRITSLDKCDGEWNTCCQHTDCHPACDAAKDVCYDSATIVWQQCLLSCQLTGRPTPIQ